MARMCDGCGDRVTRVTRPADGPAAGRWFCRDCATGRKKMTRLSWLVAFRWRVADVLPPDDRITVPVLRLMMAIDDVRRAQIQLIEADERMHAAPAAEKYRAWGDWLYFLRLLFSHLHESGYAMRQLDGVARDNSGENRVNTLLEGNREAMRALGKLRKFFSARDYKGSLIARIRNVIGSHYDERAVSALVKAEVTGDTLLDSTVASVGGLARMADPVVRAILNHLNDGDFMTDENRTQAVSNALDIAGHLITFVDHLFNALMQPHMDAVVERHTAVIDVPPLVVRVGEAVDAARKQLQAEKRKRVERPLTDGA